MSNPFYGAANYGTRAPYISTPPIGTRGIGMNTGFNQPFVSPPINPQPIMQPSVPQNLQSMIPQSNIIWIDDPNQIASFPTGMGWQQWFGLKNEQIMYIRETDMNGVTQPIRRVRYELDMINDQSRENTQSAAVPAPVPDQAQVTQSAPVQGSVTDGVTREEFNKLADAVNLMTDKLSDLLK